MFYQIMLSERRTPLMSYTRDNEKQRRCSLLLQMIHAISLIDNEIVEVLHKSCCVLEQKQRLDCRRSTDSWIK